MGQDDGSVDRFAVLTRVMELALAQCDDPEREGLIDTPSRWAKMIFELTTPPVLNFTTFSSEGYDQIVLLRDIPFYSLCEHHVIPFFGTAAVGYLPDGKIAGLSKLARAVEHFARGLQNQERLTQQVANYIMRKLDARGVGVIIKARHLCMEMRGIRKPGAETVTSCMLGVFRNSGTARNELMAMMQ